MTNVVTMPKGQESDEPQAGIDKVVDLKEVFQREQVENNSEVASRDTGDPTLINDAEIIGAEYEGLEDFLEQPVVFMLGELWDQGNRRNTLAGKW